MLLRIAVVVVVGLASLRAAETPPGAVIFRSDVQPLLERYCYDCHGDGEAKGNVAFDGFKSDAELLDSKHFWSQALKNLEAGLMPPARKEKPTEHERERIVRWIKGSVFEIDPAHPDPGRVTLRRLNRVEYRNTIADLLGVDYDTNEAFPADDTGHGFDNIADVLTLPPMLLEKYLVAANAIIARAVPLGTNAETRASSRDYARFFPKPVPEDAEARRAYAAELLGGFASRAYRRPVDRQTTERLAGLAERIWDREGAFEAGVAQAMVAVLASPRFLFRAEETLPLEAGEKYPRIDEFSLASRLSYFLWSSMPDDELFQLAREGKLREQLGAQAARMLKDRRSERFIRNFTGQWLQARDIDTVPIDASAIVNRDRDMDREIERMRRRMAQLRQKGDAQLSEEERAERDQLREDIRRNTRLEFARDLRRAMKAETEQFFEHVIREDRSLVELLDSNYTFLNEALAKHYGISNVAGRQMRKVELEPGSPRGGVLTHGSVLAVTSNPTRTSPVKRGVFILDNILGTPPPPPPPDLPPLDAAAKGAGRELTLRETLARHREDALCSSCHNRMDPLGLAFENFNAMGMWREQELNLPIDATGKLVTGEEFTDIRQLKRILATSYRRQFYHTIAEKMLTYALGRGMEYYDAATLDQIVERIEHAGGRSSALVAGVIESPAFQRKRNAAGTPKRTAVLVAPGEAALAGASTHKGNP